MVKAYGIALAAFKPENLMLHGHKADLGRRAKRFRFSLRACRIAARRVSRRPPESNRWRWAGGVWQAIPSRLNRAQGLLVFRVLRQRR
jgi:hypothetical protein